MNFHFKFFTGSSNPKYLVSGQTSCSDSDTSTFSQCSFVVQPAYSSNHEYSSSNINSTTQIIDPSLEYYDEDELYQMELECDDDRPDRPNYLDLVGQSGSTPTVPRKPFYKFSVAANAYELNNLDNEALDAPIYGNTKLNATYCVDNYASLPCDTFLVACKTESDLNNSKSFCRSPLYQSAIIPCSSKSSGNDSESCGGDTTETSESQGKTHFLFEIFIFIKTKYIFNHIYFPFYCISYIFFFCNV